MKWQELRSYYPQQWLLIEAIQARSEGNQRILDEISVIKTFLDSRTSMHSYTRLHHESPRREFYVAHTSRETLDITESWRFSLSQIMHDISDNAAARGMTPAILASILNDKQLFSE